MSEITESRQLSRRALLSHVGAIGLGFSFLPRTATTVAAATTAGKIESPGLIFEKFEAGGIAHYSYFIGDPITGEAVIIDPKRDIEDYLALAEKHRLKITHAIETHIHADFVSGSRELAARVQAQTCASIEGGVSYGFPVRPLRHGDVIDVGNLRLKAIHTPGHTPEHMSYLASTVAQPDRAWALFTGDFLFSGSVGRPDLMGVENTGQLAHKLFESLQSAYQTLPDELPIFPAHGPGSPCGAGIVAREGIPTLGIERKSNPALQYKEEGAFIENLLSTQPPIPYYWPSMKVVNAQGAKVLGSLAEPPALTPKEFKNLLADSQVQLLDTRNMMAFGGGHIPGALNIGHSSSISMWGGWLIDPKRPVALVIPEEASAKEVATWLVRVGIERFVGVLKGGMDAWTRQAGKFATLPQVSVKALNEALSKGKVQLLDVRTPTEWDHGYIRQAQYIFLPELPKRLSELDRSKPVVVYCGTGYRASIGASLLKRAGFEVSSVPGSFDGWLAAKYDVEVPESMGKASDTRRG